MSQQDWFISHLSYEDYKDFQNTLHYYTLTHTEFVGQRLTDGVKKLSQGLASFDYTTMSYADAISTLIEFCTAFEQLMLSSYEAVVVFYRSMYRFHGGEVQIEVEELLRNSDSHFPELSVELFAEKNLNEDTVKLMNMLLQEQEVIRAHLLRTTNQLQELEKVFLAELEHQPTDNQPTIARLIQDIQTLLAIDIYNQMNEKAIEMTEEIIPTIPMPSEKTPISILSARIINHADYLAMLLDYIGTDYNVPGATECIMGRWIVNNKESYLHIEAFRKFCAQHEAFHEAVEQLLKQDSLKNSCLMLRQSSALLAACIELMIEITTRTNS